jgi:putative transposase
VPSAPAGDGERAAEEAGGGARPGDRGDERGCGKKLLSVPARRQHVTYGRERGLSVRRACTLFSVARSASDYRGRKLVADGEVIERMQALSAQYPRDGHRRIRIFLAHDGHSMSASRTYRLWRLAKLQVPRKRGRKRAASSRPRHRRRRH